MHYCSEVIKYEGPIRKDYYNQFFNPNICHVCKLRGNGNLKSCKCCLVFYCSNKHKKLHYEEYSKICKIISHFVKKEPQNVTGEVIYLDDWIKSRKNLLESVQKKIERKLKPYEKQMILWSKKCYHICCKQSTTLWTCEQCFSVSYCQRHKKYFNKIHTKEHCQRLTVLLNINIGKMSLKIEKLYDFFEYIKPFTRLRDMHEFITKNPGLRKRGSFWTAIDYVLSDYFSEPLTTFYGLKKTKLLSHIRRRKVIIHVLAKFIDVHYVRFWEILYHFVPQIYELIIVCIGPEIESVRGELNCCSYCNLRNKKISFVCSSMLYHDYVRQFCQEHELPNVIVGFQMKFYEQKELYKWDETIKVIQTIKCPLLLSSSEPEISENNVLIIKDTLMLPIKPIFQDEFFFNSYVPFKDLETDNICIFNIDLTVFHNLYYPDNVDFSKSSTSS
ncbi:uncharacterized protein LOC116843070 [Odontomachus brunneus]|uniref:uncharacterized protein LOC116843070 n=1 Tax=Odontomachus brunneus TaxID=486640 RepID=UPI0013F1C8E1|nr:uncharacterized protein LOC116843070 [Odontomachus brunneus]